MRIKFGIGSLIIAAMVALPALMAQSRPNFSGEWKLNVTRSDFGPMPPPGSRLDKIDHQEPNLKVAFEQSSEQGEMKGEFKYTTDGKECVNEIGEAKFTSVLKWEENKLTFQSKGAFRDFEFESKDEWTLSADGKVLTVKRHMSSSMGEAGQTLVMEKQ